MTDSTAGAYSDPNSMPPLAQAVPLGLQHVLAMFVSNVTPAFLVGLAAGAGDETAYLIQMSILFAGVATLIQTIGFGPVGARLPIVQGTSFAFVPIMIPAVAGLGTAGLGGLMTGVLLGGIFHFCLGFIVGRIRFALPPLITGLIVLMIGLALVKVGIQYAAGGVFSFDRAHLLAVAGSTRVPAEIMDQLREYAGGPAGGFGSLAKWGPALVVIFVTLGVKFFTKGFTSIAAVFIGIVAGYVVSLIMGQVDFSRVGEAAVFSVPSPFKYGFELNWAIVIGMCLMAVVSAIETVGDTNGITKGGAGREATDEEIQGATFADGLGTAVAGVFGGLPNTSFSQNVGLVAMTGVMSRHVVTIGAVFLIICGLSPMIAAVIRTMPEHVLGGGVIVMFGMVAASGINMLADVKWNRRNMVIFATALSVGLGLQLVPEALQHLNGTLRILLTSGLLPSAIIAITLNLLIPEED